MSAPTPTPDPVPKVGWWYFVCCEHDLYQIEDADELAELLEEQLDWSEEFGCPWYHFCPTREAALDLIGPSGRIDT